MAEAQFAIRGDAASDVQCVIPARLAMQAWIRPGTPLCFEVRLDGWGKPYIKVQADELRRVAGGETSAGEGGHAQRRGVADEGEGAL